VRGAQQRHPGREFLQFFDGFSIGSNDLTQLTLGLDRDSGLELLAADFDERDPAVKAMISQRHQGLPGAGQVHRHLRPGPSDHPDSRGFDVWIPEMRGHGLSKRNQDYTRNRVADYARYDLPAIGAFVREQSTQIPHWIGHSLGGTTLAAALGGQYLGAPAVASVALFGSQVSRTYWPLKIPPLEWGARLLLKRFGPVVRPAAQARPRGRAGGRDDREHALAWPLRPVWRGRP
jgi:pimeloyl-ACP methyl ester carboxylesterase